MNTAIGRIAASVPMLAFTEVCNSMASVVNSTIPYNMFSTVNPLAAYLKPLTDTATSRVMKAIDMLIVMGSRMDGNHLKAAVEAHYKTSNSADAKGVTPAAGYGAVKTANSRTDASLPKSAFMEVYHRNAPDEYGTIPTNKSPTISSRPGPKSWGVFRITVNDQDIQCEDSEARVAVEAVATAEAIPRMAKHYGNARRLKAHHSPGAALLPTSFKLRSKDLVSLL